MARRSRRSIRKRRQRSARSTEQVHLDRLVLKRATVQVYKAEEQLRRAPRDRRAQAAKILQLDRKRREKSRAFHALRVSNSKPRLGDRFSRSLQRVSPVSTPLDLPLRCKERPRPSRGSGGGSLTRRSFKPWCR